ncbi:MAG TPA: AMP-binding protein [Rubrivivax sp.]|nr:AMP-binding protein [Rubrivivax sp.]
MNLAQLLARASRTYPQRPALLEGTVLLLRYGELADRVARRAAQWRQQRGLAAGDRVALYMGNQAAYLEAMYTAWWAGLVVVPINAKLHPREVAWILGHAEAAALVVGEDLADELRPELGGLPALRMVCTPGDDGWRAALAVPPMPPAACGPDDLAWLFYTSGTTGRPKGVMLTHRNLLAMTACYFIDVDDVAAQDSIVYAAPMSHGAGMYNFAFVARAARHVVPASGGFDPAELVALSRSTGRLCLFAAPTMVRRLVDQLAASGEPGDGFKTIVYGGGPMYVADIQRALAVMGPRFVQIYGQGESPMTITALGRDHLVDRDHPHWEARIASVGVAQTLVEVSVVGPDGRPLPLGETGEVLVRGDTVMAGYWRNPEASAEALRGGWLWTGDMGALDADGFLTLKDRSKDLIISGGSNIYPREVEEVLLAHPGVREVSVVGQPDAEWGEVVVAFVAADAGVDAAALDALCLQRIARFKRPRHYRFLPTLPKNHYGKVLKTTLRAQLDPGVPPC